jgi:predicted GIY-YIG superfamily endonuclease
MSKKNPLVSQYLENIAREALEKYQNVVRRYVRRRQGIYALYRRDKIYYIGLASNLRSRLSHHLRDRHKGSWDRFSVYLTIGDSHLKELESLILRVVKPKGNKQKGKFLKSEDIRKRFAKDIRAKQRKEFGSLLGKEKASEVVERKLVKGKQGVMANYFVGSKKLQARYKGKIIRAYIRHNGLIRFKGKDYYSPSLAAAAACKRPTCSGWRFWQYERAPGDWVKLNELR